jgi:chemotaxis protein methyltransferase CheR
MKMTPVSYGKHISMFSAAENEAIVGQLGAADTPRRRWPLANLAISDSQARVFIDMIYQKSGIVLTPDKKSLIASRLHKRLRALQLDTFHDYLDYVQTAPDCDVEIVTMIDEITTNKTAFFREPNHFKVLTANILPKLVKSDWSVLNIWSAGCSTGEEPYSLAMVLAEYFGATRNFNILATDLSTQALRTAVRAVYSDDVGQPIPVALRQKYTLTGRGSRRGQFRIAPELRERVTFQHANLIDGEWDVSARMDIIFCRNVMIYFDKVMRRQIVAGFHRRLKNGGHLFIGHAETLGDIDHRFVQVRPTVYARAAQEAG